MRTVSQLGTARPAFLRPLERDTTLGTVPSAVASNPSAWEALVPLRRRMISEDALESFEPETVER